MGWSWGPAVRREMERWGIPWVALERDLTTEELGGSPGDVSWFKGQLLIEKRCPREWVVHEIAHYIVCKKHTPEMLQKQNWGLDDYYRLSAEDQHVLCKKVGIERGVKGWDDWCESEACFLTSALLIYLHLPWHAVAYELNTLDDVWPDEFDWPSGWRPPENPRAWRIVRERILEHARPYTEGIYT